MKNPIGTLSYAKLNKLFHGLIDALRSFETFRKKQKKTELIQNSTFGLCRYFKADAQIEIFASVI